AGRSQIKEIKKPDVNSITGLSPTIAIEQKSVGKNPRSTVGTLTNIYDFMRILFSKIGTFHCPISFEKVMPMSDESILREILINEKNAKIQILAPVVQNKKGHFKELLEQLLKKGFLRVRIDDEFKDLSEKISLNPSKHHRIDLVIDRLIVNENNHTRLQESIFQALEEGEGVFSIYNNDTREEKTFSKHAYSPKSKKFYPPLDPQDFSFNHPSGMCETCAGLGEVFEFDIEKIVDPDLSISEDCFNVGPHYKTIRYSNIYKNLAKQYDFSVTTAWKNLSKKAKQIILYGTKEKWTPMLFFHPIKKTTWQEFVHWKGVLNEAKERLKESKSEIYRNKIQSLMHHSTCHSCHGSKIKPYPAAATLYGKTIHELASMPIKNLLEFFQKITLTDYEKIIAEDLFKEIIQRLQYLIGVGLHYLTLSRTAPSLSGGESQRIRLASLIGSGLKGTTYILDEPSIGLHPEDHDKLLQTILKLKKDNNTIILVEHDPKTMMHADTIVDFGPLAGKFGGEIIYQGNLKNLLVDEKSLTGKYLSNRKRIEIPKPRPSAKDFLILKKASTNNLKNVDLKIPLNRFICITGVSGSGKSSLISQTLYPALSNKLHRSSLKTGPFDSINGIEKIDKVIFVDQSPIGRSNRSNPATYTKVLDDIRQFFTSLKESKMKGLTPGHFSFNVKEGSCPYCKGMGQIKIDMDFMEDEWTTCPECKGKRFSSEILQVKYKDQNILDILEMDIDTACDLFKPIPNIYKKLHLLQKVGLGYIHLGQASTTLSGGEAQRIKLAKELNRPETGKTLYIFDEPTTGLHFKDIDQLLNILYALVDKGNTVLVIEHNSDFIKTCDYVIELGPEGGENGGKIIAEGNMKKFLKENTATAKFLKQSFAIPTHINDPKPLESFDKSSITIEKAAQNNLKNISLSIPHNQLTVLTGPSGSGKSSLAFETIYAEAIRRYLDAMPASFRQMMNQMTKPKVEKILGLTPAVSVEQKHHKASPRSTIGTITEIYDHLRILFTHAGIAYCPDTHEKITTISPEFIANKIIEEHPNAKMQVLAPQLLKYKQSFQDLIDHIKQSGYIKLRLNNHYYDLDEPIAFNPKEQNEILIVVDRLIIRKENKNRILEAIEKAAELGEQTLFIALEKEDLYFNLSHASEISGKSYPPITTATFSFNSEQGMCLECQGIGTVYTNSLIDNPKFLTLNLKDLYYLFIDGNKASYDLFKSYFKKCKIDLKTPLENLSKTELDLIFNGASAIEYQKDNISFKWGGITPLLSYAAKHAKSWFRQPLMHLLKQKTCPVCHGNRLNPLASNVKVENKTLPEICSMPIFKLKNWIESLNLKQTIVKDSLHQILKKLEFLIEIGLHYICLNRSAPTLSTGELQRIFIAKQLGSTLTHCTYIIDEPTVGLHPHNTRLLLKALEKLLSHNNTLVLVEHDFKIIERADQIFDFGPKAGKFGGEILAHGTLEEIKNNPNSLTGQYLSKQKKVFCPAKKRKSKEFITIQNAHLHNLKNIDVEIPTNMLVGICGVSGAGKSTLINDLLTPAIKNNLLKRHPENNVTYQNTYFKNLDLFKNLIYLDQKNIGLTNRADISTYCEIMTHIRSFYTQLPEAKTQGIQPRYFSYNHIKGMCPHCKGIGYKTIDLQFLPPVEVVCDHCKGYRLNEKALKVKYKGKHIGHLLKMSIYEALEFFEAIPKVKKRLEKLISVNLGYLSLGQEIASLSGGEAQRLRLAKELMKRSLKNTLYIFDEPSKGQHVDDLNLLMPLFHEIIDRGNSMILIDHSIEVLANCDYLVELGPQAGDEGGKIIAKGPLDSFIQFQDSNTSSYLLEYLKTNNYL
ncbi:MAG TPA: excinuclease ABC subunit UvrA, partial [Chlamydiales bacterium]|nr:excinuclease ABC subunit UvrA [Chlamydiales bacterium]